MSLAHIAINADDVEGARRFYAATFGWESSAWGPPGFFQLQGTGLRAAALQPRRELGGIRVVGFEGTVAVDDVDATMSQALAHGGRQLMARTRIEGVGDLAWVADPSDNPVGLMRYEA
jgi:uncharacterized protein